jgi:hypothetical protein
MSTDVKTYNSKVFHKGIQFIPEICYPNYLYPRILSLTKLTPEIFPAASLLSAIRSFRMPAVYILK